MKKGEKMKMMVMKRGICVVEAVKANYPDHAKTPSSQTDGSDNAVRFTRVRIRTRIRTCTLVSPHTLVKWLVCVLDG